jgi:hypothetical protein
MAPQLNIDRQEHLEQLSSFFWKLDQPLKGLAASQSISLSQLHAAVSAECVQCGIVVPGEVLFALAEPPAQETGAPDAKASRLRQGYCARRGCDSYYYRITFSDLPGVDWQSALAAADVLGDAPGPEPDPSAADESSAPIRHWRLALTAFLAASVLLLFLGWRQWYRGGTLPFVREAEQFEVDRFAQPEP